jgi:hypothetical protein
MVHSVETLPNILSVSPTAADEEEYTRTSSVFILSTEFNVARL